MLRSRALSIVLSIAVGAAIGAFLFEIFGVHSLVAGISVGGSVGAISSFTFFNRHRIRQKVPEIWKQVWRNASRVRREHIEHFVKSVGRQLALATQWALVMVALPILFGDPSSYQYSGLIITSLFGCLGLIIIARRETEEICDQGKDPRNASTAMMLRYGNIFMPPYYLIRGIRWLAFAPTSWVLFTVLPAVLTFVVQLVKAVYTRDSWLVTAWGGIGAIAGGVIGATPLMAAIAGGVVGAVFGGLQVWLIVALNLTPAAANGT